MTVDVLSDVLTTLELSSRIWFRAELSSPFAVAVPEEADGNSGVIRFHVATEGSCSVAVDGVAPVAFGPGDLVLIPHGAAHVLSDDAGRPAVPLDEALAEAGFEGGGPLTLGGGGATTVVVCGEFGFGDPARHPFVASLPPILHVPADATTSYGWIEQVLRHVESEARQRATGHLEVIRRLSEILLIEVLRVHEGEGGIGALSALADPQLGPALEAMHAEPEAPWTLERLARIAGQSRTLFALRFRERLGVPPMKYLASWRMQKAGNLLARGSCPVSEVARRVGYASESAFNRSFREQFGAPPGAYRRSQVRA